jgi:hypothetical protein
MEYCGIKTSNVRASTRSGRSKTGKETKPRRSHSRRRCYKTDDKSLNTSECMIGTSSRCVIRGKNPEVLERRRSMNRSKYVRRSRVGSERVMPVVTEPVMTSPTVSNGKKRGSVSSKKTSLLNLSSGPYVFNFVADTNFPKKKGSKETTLSQVKKYYNDVLTKYKTNPNYENIDTFNVESVDENEYKGTLTLNNPPSSLSEVNKLIEDILTPDFVLENVDIHIFPDYIEDTLELDGRNLNQAGGRKKLRY